MKKWGGLFWLFVGCFLCIAGNVFAVTLMTDFSRFEIERINQGSFLNQSFSNGYTVWIEDCYGGACGGDEKQVILFDGYKRTQLTNIVEHNPNDPGERNVTISDLYISNKNVFWKEDGEQKVYEIPNYKSMLVPPSKFTAFGFNEDMYIFDGNLTKLTDKDLVDEKGFYPYNYEDLGLEGFRQSANSLAFVTSQPMMDPFGNGIGVYSINFYDYERDELFYDLMREPIPLGFLYFENNIGYIEKNGGPKENLYYFKYNPEHNTAAVPEPATLLLFGTGLLGAFVRRKRKA